MEIINKRSSTTVPFKDIAMGECFLTEDNTEPCMKLNLLSYDEYTLHGFPNAVGLFIGQPWHCDENRQVFPIKAKTIVEH